MSLKHIYHFFFTGKHQGWTRLLLKDCKSPLGALFVFSVKMCICVIEAHTPLPTSSSTITSAGHLGGVCNEGARAAPKAEGDMGDYMCIPVLI